MKRITPALATAFISALLLVPPSIGNADQLLTGQNAVGQQDAATQLKLGLAYEAGDGVPQDHAKAVVWYRRAACQGNVEAQLKLSEAYHLGRGVQQNFFLAGWWLLKVADKREKAARAKRREWQSKAAKGDAEAQEQLRKTEDKVMKLIERAEQGSPDAQNQLARAYTLGDGVARNPTHAAVWNRRSAEQGNALGQLFLAMAYAEGAGVSQDNVEAVKWFSIVLKSTKGPKRKVIEMAMSFTLKEMTPDQILAAKNLARQWRAKPSSFYTR